MTLQHPTTNIQHQKDPRSNITLENGAFRNCLVFDAWMLDVLWSLILMLDVIWPSAPQSPCSSDISTPARCSTRDGGFALAEGDEFLVVDSGSTDATLAIATRHGARVFFFSA